jgi:hypothetical protein
MFVSLPFRDIDHYHYHYNHLCSGSSSYCPISNLLPARGSNNGQSGPVLYRCVTFTHGDRCVTFTYSSGRMGTDASKNLVRRCLAATTGAIICFPRLPSSFPRPVHHSCSRRSVRPWRTTRKRLYARTLQKCHTLFTTQQNHCHCGLAAQRPQGDSRGLPSASSSSPRSTAVLCLFCPVLRTPTGSSSTCLCALRPRLCQHQAFQRPYAFAIA